MQGRRVPGFSSLHPHLRTALVQCATMTTLLVQVGALAVTVLHGGDTACPLARPA